MLVMREGKRARTKFLDVRALSSPLSHPRVAIVVPRSGNPTTLRNRLKRRLREVVRLDVLPLASAADFVFRAKAEAYSASFEQLRGDVMSGVRRVQRMLDVTSR
jgi:ribonuclease P protein component